MIRLIFHKNGRQKSHKLHFSTGQHCQEQQTSAAVALSRSAQFSGTDLGLRPNRVKSEKSHWSVLTITDNYLDKRFSDHTVVTGDLGFNTDGEDG